MQIDEILIQNFRSFQDRTYRFGRQFTVIIGDNGSGKTTILQSLAVAAGSFLLGIDGMGSRVIDEAEIRQLTINGQPKPQKPVVITAKGKIDGQVLSWTRDILIRNTRSSQAQSIKQLAERKLKASREQSDILFPIIVFHSTGRLWSEHERINFQKQEEGINRGYKNCLSAKASSIEFLNWFKTQEDLVSKNIATNLNLSLLQAFKASLIDIIPDNKLENIVFDPSLNTLIGIFVKDGIKQKLRYEQLSDGYRNIINLVADICFRCIQLNPHLGANVIKCTPGIVLIDELDLHLHPKWQKRVVDDLKRIFPLIQFVATTHSPFIVQSLAKDELIDLERDNLVEDEQGNKYNDGGQETLENDPKDETLNAVVTENFRVEDNRSIAFIAKYKSALDKLQKLKSAKDQYKVDDYLKISQAFKGVIMDETNDPVLKARIVLTTKKPENETNS